MRNRSAILHLLTFILTLQTAFAQSAQRDLLKHFSEEQIKNALYPPGKWHPFPTTPDEWKQRYPDSLLKRITSDGESALKKTYPTITATVTLDYVRNGDSKLRYEKQLFAKREILWTVAIAESVEGKGRFIDKIADGVWSVCEESFWGSTSVLGMQKKGVGLPDVSDPVVDLYSAETAAELAWVDYFNGPALDGISKIIRQRIRYEVNRRVFAPLQGADYFYLKNPKPNNWAPWIMSNYINAQLLLEDNEAGRAQAIHFAMNITDRYINGLGADGGSDEGLGYWSQAVGCVFDELNLLYDASKGQISIYQEPFLQKMGSYIYKVHLSGNSFINIGDAVPGRMPNALMLYRYGKAVGDKQLMNFASWTYHKYFEGAQAPYLNASPKNKSRTLYNMQVIQELSAYPYNEPFLPDTYISDIQLMTAKAKNGLIVAAYGGNNGQSHNHNDVGNILVYLNDTPVILDVGPGAYTSNTFSDKRYTLWFNRSEYHNLPIINGYGQKEGKAYAAGNVSYKKGEKESTFELDLEKAYPVEAGVIKWHRTISMDKPGGVIKLVDQYQLAKPAKSLQQVFMTTCTSDISVPGMIRFATDKGNTVIMTYDSGQWEVKKEKMPLDKPEDRNFKETFKGKDIWRLLMISKTNPSSSTTVYSFHN